MKANLIATFSATLAMLSTVNAVGAEIKLYTGSGCSGDSHKMMLDGRDPCTPVSNVGSAKQDKLDNGLKYTCNAFSDADCKNKVGEVYDCVSGSIGSISCVGNGPL